MIIIWLFCFLICIYKIMKVIFGMYTIKIPALVDFSSQKDFIKRQSDWSGERCASYIDVYFAHLRFIPIISLYIREYLWKIKGKYYIRNIFSAKAVISRSLLYLWWFGFVWSLFLIYMYILNYDETINNLFTP